MRRVTAAGLSLALIFAVAPESAAAEPPEQADPDFEEVKDLFYRGSASFSASNYDAAIELFTAALEKATVHGADPQIRGALLLNLASAHVHAFDLDHEGQHLRIAVDIFERFLREADSQGYPEEDVEKTKADVVSVREKLAEYEASESGSSVPTEPSKPVEDEPVLEPASSPSQDQTDAAPGNKKRGVALVASGAVLIAGGAGMLGFGTIIKPRAQDQIDEFDDPQDYEQAYLAEEQRKGAIWLGTGGAIAAVGVGLLIWGAVDLSRAKKGGHESARVHGAPWLGKGLAGVSLGGSF